MLVDGVKVLPRRRLGAGPARSGGARHPRVGRGAAPTPRRGASPRSTCAGSASWCADAGRVRGRRPRPEARLLSRAMNVPEELRYSTDHEWVAPRGRRRPHRHHRLRPGCPRRRRLRPGPRGRHRRSAAGRHASARSSRRSRSPTSTRPIAGTIVAVNDDLADAPRAGQRGSLRRRVALRDRAGRPGRARRRCSTRRLPGPRRGLRDPWRWRTSSATSAGTATRPSANFCSSCGAALDLDRDDRTITFHPVDPLQDAPGPTDDVVVNLAELPAGGGVLRGAQRVRRPAHGSR